MENRAKTRKCPISLGLGGEFFLFTPSTLEHPPLHFSDDQFAPLIAKIGQKIKKTVFLDQFQTVTLTFCCFLPTIMGQVRFFIIPPISFGIESDQPAFRFYSLPQSKFVKKKLIWGATPPNPKSVKTFCPDLYSP